MEEEDSSFAGMEPVEEDWDESMEMESSSKVDSKADPSFGPIEEDEEEQQQQQEEVKAGASEPPVDWFEPLEDEEDANSTGKLDPEEESVAGESERSESVISSEKAFKKTPKVPVVRRKRTHPDEGWVEWPILGEGWKRREVIRQSGSSMGQKDVYYLSPHLERVRSRVELLSVIAGEMDMTRFDYKSGRFQDKAPPLRVRRAKRKVRESSSSESSYMERGDGADTPDSNQSFTPTPKPKPIYPREMGSSFISTISTQSVASRYESVNKIKLPSPCSTKLNPLPSINGEVGSDDGPLICAKCGIPFIGTWYDKQRKKPCCRSCWALKTREHPMIRFRKWIPCGQCVGCYNTVNCGLCANCKAGLNSSETRKRVCRKRKCVCPIRKDIGNRESIDQRFQGETFDYPDDNSEHADSQQQSHKNSDTENASFNYDVDDDDDMSTDDDDDWHKKRKRRACGECKACLCRRDCGTCDFCIDKPKFGGSNKKRQKCRLRQCQRQAMRHLLPFQMGQSELGPDGPMMAGRPRPHYTYSRKTSWKKNKELDPDWSEHEDDDSNLPPMNWREPVSENTDVLDQNLNQSAEGSYNGFPNRGLLISKQKDWPARLATETTYTNRGNAPKQVNEEEELPMISNVFSFAELPATSGADVENQLLKLLHSLRSSVLPIMWYAILDEGPQLQLIQCSKHSIMTDTRVLIDPGFCYQITVQKQPLLPTHPIYDRHPGRLASVTDVVNLLLALEKLGVCHGLPFKDSPQQKEPIILERASTCDFLVEKDVSVCSNCKALIGL